MVAVMEIQIYPGFILTILNGDKRFRHKEEVIGLYVLIVLNLQNHHIKNKQGQYGSKNPSKKD